MNAYVSWIAAHAAVIAVVLLVSMAVASVCDTLAKALAKLGYSRPAHVLAGVAALLSQIVTAAAHFLAAFTGKPFPLPDAPAAQPAPAPAPPAKPGFVHRKPLTWLAIVSILAMFVLLPVALHGCGPTQHPTGTVSVTGNASPAPDGGVNWQAGVGVAITFQRQIALPAAQSLSASIPASARPQYDRIVAEIADALPGLEDSWQSVVAHPNDPSARCRLRASLEVISAHEVDLMHLLTTVGVAAPPILPTVIALLGPAADLFITDCALPSTPAPIPANGILPRLTDRTVRAIDQDSTGPHETLPDASLSEHIARALR